jgi:hypothetical protein
MQIILAKGLGFPGHIADKLAGSIRSFNRLPDGSGLCGGWKQLDLGNQLHTPDCSTYVLSYQGLSLLILAFFKVALDGFRANISSRTSGITICSQGCILAPILAGKAFELFLRLAHTIPFEKAHYFRQGLMIGHNLDCQNFKPVLCGNFHLQHFQPRLNRARQNPFMVARYPHQMVINYLGIMRGVPGFCRHGSVLAKEGGFLHPLKAGGSRRQ